ncbi:MAG: hypothetical protein N3C12_13285 [Candidatus Binatia bacterium]|nr:hypothetical protein [Candidatus Binatia bacterium]
MLIESVLAAVRAGLWGALCLYIPGRAWSAWLYGHVPLSRTAASPLFFEVTASVVATTWVGFFLLEAGAWSPITLATTLSMLSVLGFWLSRGHSRPRYCREDAQLIGLAAILCCWLFPPLEARFSAGDATGYIAAGIHAARAGGFAFSDPTIGLIDIDLRRALFPSVAADRGSPPYLRLEGGYVLRSLDGDALLPAFHHGIVPWVALAASVLEMDQVEWIFVVFGVLAFAAIFATARSLGAPPLLSLGAAALAATQPALFFYARFPMPEMPAAFFLWAGVAMAGYSAASGRLTALASLTLGCAALLRLENAFLVIVALAFCAAFVPGVSNKRALLLPAFLLSIQALLHAYLWRTHYWGNLLNLLRTHQIAIAGILAGCVAMLLAARRSDRWRNTSMPLCEARTVFAGLVVLALVSTGFLQAWVRHGTEWDLLRAASGGFLAPFGLFSLLLAAVRAPLRVPQVLFVILTLEAAVIFFLAPNATPVSFWVVRRAVPLLLPGLCLALVAAVVSCTSRMQRSRQLLLTGAIMVTALWTQYGALSLLLRQHYFAGGRLHFKMLEGSLMPHSILIMSGRLAPLSFAPLLWATTQSPVYYVGNPQNWLFSDLVRTLAAAGRPIYLVQPSHLPVHSPSGKSGHWLPQLRYAFSTTSPFHQARPEDGAWQDVDLSVYRWSP